MICERFKQVLEDPVVIINEIFAEFIKNNNHNTMFLFGLDSFRYQSRLLDLEYEDMKRLYASICNRIYCEYYKLHKLVNEYLKENINENKIMDLIKKDDFVQYKDLEPFKIYEFQQIHDIHENILLIISSLHGYVQGKEHELKNYNVKKEMGLSIDNFVFTFNYSIVVVKEKLNLFISYMGFFHRFHLKYLRKFTRKIQLMLNEINNDIKFEDNIKPINNTLNTNKNKEKIHINNDEEEIESNEDYYKEMALKRENNMRHSIYSDTHKLNESLNTNPHIQNNVNSSRRTSHNTINIIEEISKNTFDKNVHQHKIPLYVEVEDNHADDLKSYNDKQSEINSDNYEKVNLIEFGDSMKEDFEKKNTKIKKKEKDIEIITYNDCFDIDAPYKEFNNMSRQEINNCVNEMIDKIIN